MLYDEQNTYSMCIVPTKQQLTDLLYREKPNKWSRVTDTNDDNHIGIMQITDILIYLLSNT